MSSWTPTVSVVVPVYNAEHTIDACIASLLELRYPADRVEIAAVDNGSSDGTLRALRRYGGRILLLQEARRGPAAARNAGVRVTVGEVVAFTDADCRVDPDWLSRLVGPLEDPGVGIAGGRILAAPPANEVERFGEAIHDHRSAIEVFEPPYAIGMSWASRRAALDGLGGFDESLRRGEDVDLSYRLVRAGYSLAYVDSALLYHRNERHLRGLFREGFLHGLAAVQVRRRHAAFLRAFGHSNGSLRGYRKIGRNLLDGARGRDPVRARCEAAFNSGKRTGEVLGSARFRRRLRRRRPWKNRA